MSGRRPSDWLETFDAAERPTVRLARSSHRRSQLDPESAEKTHAARQSLEQAEYERRMRLYDLVPDPPASVVAYFDAIWQGGSRQRRPPVRAPSTTHELLSQRVYRTASARLAERIVAETEAQWVGRVEEVRDEIFVASLGAADAAEPSHLVEIRKTHVSTGEADLVLPGALFYWTVGMREEEGRRLGFSALHFPRTPRLSADALAAAEQRARRLRALLGGGQVARDRPRA